MVYIEKYQVVNGYFKTMSYNSKTRYSFRWLAKSSGVAPAQVSFDFNNKRIPVAKKDSYNQRMILYIRQINKVVKLFNSKGNELPELDIKNYII